MAVSEPIVLAAEITALDAGDLARLLAAAADAGADALVLPDIAPGVSARLPYELGDFAGEAPAPTALGAEALQALAAAAASRLTLVATVSDDGGLALALRARPAVLRVASAALVDLPFLTRLAGASDAAVWLDTAMATGDEVEEAVAALVRHRGRLTLLHGLATSGSRPDELNLRAVATLAARFALRVGFQARDATPAACVAATALGAEVIVVPFADRATPDAFDRAGFRALAADVQLVARALGDGDKRVQPSEWALRDRRQRSVDARVEIARGALVTADMLATAPPGLGLKPRALTALVGRRAAIDIPGGTLLTLGMLE